MINDARDVLLGDGLNGQAQLIADGFAGVPGVGRFELGRMRDLLLKFLRGQIAAVSVCKRQAVFVYVVAVSAFDLRDLMAAAGDQRNHIDPENVLHAAAGDGAGILFGKSIQTVDLCSGRRPGINGLFAGRNYVNAAGYALFHVVINIADEAEQGNDRHIRIALIEDLIGVV